MHLTRFCPGDAIGFSGTGCLSAAINLATLGIPGRGIAHVGIVSDDPELGLVLIESTTLAPDPCLIRGLHTRGPQAQPLIERIEAAAGRVYHYPLRRRAKAFESIRLAAYLRAIVKQGLPYDMIGAAQSRSMVVAMIHRWKFGRENLDALFCSELVAATWRAGGRFHTLNASRWNPNSLLRTAVTRGTVQQPIRLK